MREESSQPGSWPDTITAGPHSEPGYPELPEWLEELYPFRTRRVTVGDYRMSLVDEGPATGSPLLLLHGNPGWSFTFRKLIPQLSGRYRVIAPDLVGFGLSDKPADAAYHTLSRHIENLTALIAALGLSNLTLLLHDWGGPIGLGYAVAQPENVSRLLLTNTWAFPIPNPKSFRLPFGARICGSRLGAMLDSLLGLSITSALSHGTRKADDMMLEGYKYPSHSLAGWIGPRAFWRMLPPTGSADQELEHLHSQLPRITAQVDIVWGGRDSMLTRLPAYMLRDSLKNARQPSFVEAAPHYVAEDAPEALATKLLEQRKPQTTLKIIA